MPAIVIVALPAYRLSGAKGAPLPRHFFVPPVTLEPGTSITIEAVDDAYVRVLSGGARFAVAAVELARSVAVQS